MGRTRTFRGTARIAMLVSAAVAVLGIVAAVVLVALAGPRATVTSVDVHDDAGVVDPVLLEEEIGSLRTYAPVRVVVWTRDGEYSDNINESTLTWARDRPDDGLLSSDGRYWADGLLVLTVSVEQNDGIGSGQVGTYFGEDVAIEPTSAQKDLQSLGYDDFRARDWTAGVEAIADGAAGEMARPAWTRPVVTVGLPALVVVAALAHMGGLALLAGRFADANSAFSSATQNVHDRVSATEYILDHGFGARVRSTAGSVLRQYDRTLDLRNALEAVPLWKMSAANVFLWRDVAEVARSAADIGDSTAMLGRATALYMRDGSWEQVWADEVQETADHLVAARDDERIGSYAGAAAAQELAAFCEDALRRLDDVRARGVAAGGEEISDCLDEIAAIRAELTGRMQRIEASARPANASKARYVDRALNRERWSRNDSARSITGFYDRRSFYSPRSFVVGYAAGARQHRAAQERAKRARSSGGSTTGYGSSGGGFRGSGSSSRF